ncbi:MAG: hypothetical protein A2452_10530 [Candidatus Firestonebacteria bacterium RIFOXYC2_FULL_39_67]|nr:MAG: hypothetical protein A2452_10530 [Candidatus Firestonebacteria bacterium RIFOXYC2_FULL_39_67]
MDKIESIASCSNIYEETRQYIRRHCYIESDEFVDVLALYVFLNRCWDLFDTLPYIWLRGNPSCGKTVLLEVLASLIPVSQKVSEITTAALRRILEESHPCLIIDEAEYLNNADMRRILRAGYRRGGVYVKAGKDETTVRYDCYSPKIIADNIGPKEQGLGTRCIVYSMEKSPEVLLRFVPSKTQESDFLSDGISEFVLSKRPAISELLNKLTSTNLSQGSSRFDDLWLPLFILAYVIDASFEGSFVSPRVKSFAKNYVEKAEARNRLANMAAMFAFYLTEYFKKATAKDEYYRLDELYEDIKQQGYDFSRWSFSRVRRYMTELDIVSDSWRMRVYDGVGSKRKVQRMCVRFDKNKIIQLASQAAEPEAKDA